MFGEYDIDYGELINKQKSDPLTMTERQFIILKCLDYQKWDLMVAQSRNPMIQVSALKARGKVFRDICAMAKRVKELPSVHAYFASKGRKRLGYMNNAIHPGLAIDYVLHIQDECVGAGDDRIKPTRFTELK